MSHDLPMKLSNHVYTGEMAKVQEFRTLSVGDLFKYPGSDAVLMVIRLPAGSNRAALSLTYGMAFVMAEDREVIRIPDGTTVHIDQGGMLDHPE